MKLFMALYIGTATAAEKAASPVDEATIARGMAAWGEWAARNAAAIVDPGSPLGRTKRASPAGIADIVNAVTAYTIVRAEDHAAAARLFENHPHFAIFPGDSVEIVECLPMPGG
jgi:hypothetical protein